MTARVATAPVQTTLETRRPSTVFEFPQTKVAHIRSCPSGWETNPAFVYIGRAGHGFGGYFGNPYKLEHGDQRGSSLLAYREYLKQRMTADPAFAKAVAGLHGRVLVCFCKPNPCHGDLLAWAADEMAKRLATTPAEPKEEPQVKDEDIFWLGIVGSRGFFDRKAVEEVVQAYLEDGARVGIVSGGAAGADSLARLVAQEYGLPLREYLPDWKQYGRAAGFRRNTDIVKHASEVLAFFADGPKSAGTSDTVGKAVAAEKPCFVYHEGRWAMANKQALAERADPCDAYRVGRNQCLCAKCEDARHWAFEEWADEQAGNAYLNESDDMARADAYVERDIETIADAEAQAQLELARETSLLDAYGLEWDEPVQDEAPHNQFRHLSGEFPIEECEPCQRASHKKVRRPDDYVPGLRRSIPTKPCVSVEVAS